MARLDLDLDARPPALPTVGQPLSRTGRADKGRTSPAQMLTRQQLHRGSRRVRGRWQQAQARGRSLQCHMAQGPNRAAYPLLPKHCFAAADIGAPAQELLISSPGLQAAPRNTLTDPILLQI